MIEKCLIEHCAPTLASLKAANLFNACCEEGENIELQISMWNQLMNPKGVKLLALRSRGNRSLVYVYREKQLVRKDVYKRQLLQHTDSWYSTFFVLLVSQLWVLLRER